MKAKLLVDCSGVDGPQPAGTVIDHPDCYRLVQANLAEPADEECKELVASKLAALAEASKPRKAEMAARKRAVAAKKLSAFEQQLKEGL